MGCTQSGMDTRGLHERVSTLTNQVADLDKHDTLDVRTLTMLMWKARDSPELLEVLSDLVATQSDEQQVFDGVEFYLPQLAHMVIHLEANIGSTTLEAFALLVSQLSLHFALQLYWILVAAMQDYQPEDETGRRNPGADPELYVRCANLLHKVEQSVVFGSPRCPAFEQLFAEGKLTREELNEIELADRRFMAAQIATDDTDDAFQGLLGYKRWNKTSRFQRKKWQQRYFKVQHRVLLCYRIRDGELKRSIPLQHTTVTVKQHRMHKYYFELKESKRERVYKLYAQSRKEMEEWVAILRQEAAAPPSYAPTDFDTTTLTPQQIGRYGFFRSEREFVRALTDICEELRFVEPPDRKELLVAKSENLSIPGCVYLPLTKSTDPWRRVIAINSNKGHPFSTRERCPCLMTFEVAGDGPTNIDVANYLYQTLGVGGGGGVGLEHIRQVSDVTLESGAADSLELGSDLLRASWQRKFVESARESVSKFGLSSVNGDSRVEEIAQDGHHGDDGAAHEADSAAEGHGEHPDVAHTDEVDSHQEDAPGVLANEAEEEAPVGEGDKAGARPPRRRAPSNLGMSTRKIVQSARGAAISAKKGAAHTIGTLKHAVAKRNREPRPDPRANSIWDKTSDQADGSTANPDNAQHPGRNSRKKERQNMNKQRALELIRSKSHGNKHASADNQGQGDQPAPVKAEDVQPKLNSEGPFLRSLGRLAVSAPRKRKESVTRQLAEKLQSTDVGSQVQGDGEGEADIAATASEKETSRVIAKSNDDLRQEVFIMQLIQFIHDVWVDADLELLLHPYRILSTSKDCGMLEVVQDSNSIDGLKKEIGSEMSLLQHFQKKFGVDTPELRRARKNFITSLAAYSVVCYILGIKDRHNGNIMLSNDGCVTHIDFGFVFGMAPGKDKVPHTNFSMERAAFKLTGEMVEFIGGYGSTEWKQFDQMIVDGLLVCRKQHDTLLTLIEIMGYKSNYPCFNQPGGGVKRVLREMKSRLMLDLTEEQAAVRMRRLTKSAFNHKGTVLYEKFQKWSNGIEPIF